MSNHSETRFDDSQLEDMRLQMMTLKKKLEKQEIVNERLMRKSLRSNTTNISNRYFWICLICALNIPYGYWAFCILGGSSLGVWIFESILMLSVIGYTFYLSRQIHDSRLFDSNLLEVRQTVARTKKLDSNWTFIGFPAALLWIAYFLYDKYQQMAGEEFQLFAVAMCTAAIIGAAVGLKIHIKTQRQYQEIIDQIETVTAE